MTLSAENIALKAENARLREALDAILESPRWLDEATIPRAGIDVAPKQVVFNASIAYLKIATAQQALAQPTPTTPETDKAQAVVDAALTHRTPEWSKSRFIAAVEAYRGGA